MIAKPMIEEAILPRDAGRFGEKTLQGANDGIHSLRRRKRDERVKMVGHCEQQMRPKHVAFSVVFECTAENRKRPFVGQLIRAARRAAER